MGLREMREDWINREQEESKMTPDEALSIVDTNAAGRTRFAGMEPYADEVLAAEVRRLRNELASRAVSREDYERWVRAYSQGNFAACQKP